MAPALLQVQKLEVTLALVPRGGIMAAQRSCLCLQLHAPVNGYRLLLLSGIEPQMGTVSLQALLTLSPLF